MKVGGEGGPIIPIKDCQHRGGTYPAKLSDRAVEWAVCHSFAPLIQEPGFRV